MWRIAIRRLLRRRYLTLFNINGSSGNVTAVGRAARILLAEKFSAGSAAGCMAVKYGILIRNTAALFGNVIRNIGAVIAIRRIWRIRRLGRLSLRRLMLF